MNNTEITETIENVQTISTEELASRLNRRDRFEFWNVLTAEYYSNENITGSRHVPLDQIGREVANTNLPKDTEIVVYCAGQECPQSWAAAQKLQTYGYMNIKVYKGGLEEWETAGLPIKTDEDIRENDITTVKTEGASCH